jgi:CheY-like chemotaxis protein
MNSGKTPLLLIADDNPVVRKMIRFSLRGIPARFLEATGGAEALEVIRSQQPDLVILDYDLGDMNASGILRDLAATSLAPGKIILLTAYDQEFISDQHLGEAVGKVVTKPFSPNELMLLVREVLG